MSELLLLAGGAALVVAVIGDVIATVLAPEARGWLSAPVGRAVWAIVRALERPALFGIGGTLAVLTTLAVWFTLMWLGFALLIGGSGGAIAPSAEGAAAGAGPVLRALYLSGTALTTVGFGDLVAASKGGLILTVLAAGAGLAVVTAAISYVLSVYPLISSKRAAAAWASDLGADRPDRSAALILTSGERWLAQLHARLDVLDQELRRFPVLYYFHSSRREEELTVVLRATYLTVVHLEWTLLDEGGSGEAARRLYVRPLRLACTRLTGGLAANFVLGDAVPPKRAELDRTFEQLAQGAIDAGAQPAAEPPPAQLREFVAQGERFLRAFADAHGYAHESLVQPPGGSEPDPDS